MIRSEQVHGTAVAFERRALLILGPSGSGKSSLALELIATGGQLVSDDRTDLRREGDRIIASAPKAIAGQIEARGLGILHADHLADAELALIVDLGQSEDKRYPAAKQQFVLGLAFPLVLGPFRPHLYAALRQCLLYGWSQRSDRLPTEGSEIG